MTNTNSFLKPPWIVILGVVFVLMLGAVFMLGSGAILGHRYHQGNATLSGH